MKILFRIFHIKKIKPTNFKLTKSAVEKKPMLTWKGLDRIVILLRSIACWNLRGMTSCWSLSNAWRAILYAPMFLLCFARAYSIDTLDTPESYTSWVVTQLSTHVKIRYSSAVNNKPKSKTTKCNYRKEFPVTSYEVESVPCWTKLQEDVRWRAPRCTGAGFGTRNTSPRGAGSLGTCPNTGLLLLRFLVI